VLRLASKLVFSLLALGSKGCAGIGATLGFLLGTGGVRLRRNSRYLGLCDRQFKFLLARLICHHNALLRHGHLVSKFFAFSGALV